MGRIKDLWNYCGSDPEALAQLAHVGWGGFGTLLLHMHYSWLVSVVAMAILAVAKEISEFWTETGETRGSTLVDIGFFWLGIALAVWGNWL